MSNQTKNATLVGGGGGQKPLNSQSLETKNPKSSKSLDSNSKTNKALESQKISKIELESKKIQRAKSTLDSTTKKAKESSKTKSFVRIIPTSIALASALASNMAAAPSDLPSGVNQDFQNVVLEEASGNNPKVTVSGTISNGTIISGTAIVSGGSPNHSGRQSQDRNDLIQGDGGATSTIINGWDIKAYNQANGVSDGNGGVLVNKNINHWSYERIYEVLRGTKAGNLTFGNISFSSGYYGNLIRISEGASAATITNNGTIKLTHNRPGFITLADGASVDAIVNNKIITAVGNNVLNLSANTTLGMLKNSGTMSTTNTNLVNLSGSGSSIDKIELLSGSTTSARTNIINAQSSATIGTITADNATIKGGINLAGTSSITNGISLDNQSNMTGGITLGGSSNIAGISLANASTITGGVTLNGSSSIDNISISGSNATLSGNITIGTARGNSASIGNITISNGGTYAGTIHTKNQTSIDGITIANGGVVGSVGSASTIISSGNSTIHNIDIQDGGTMYGNIEAHWVEKANANNEQDSSGAYKDGNIGDVSIAGRLQGDIVVYNKVVMDSLTMSENGTITGSVRVGHDGDNTQTPTLSTIALSGNSGINAIVLGNSNGNGPRATINSLTLEGTSSIGTITNNSNATIVNLTLNETSTITNGITNDSNIGSLDLQNNTTYSGTGSITNALDIANNKTLNANTNGINILFANNATGTINNAGIISGSLTNTANSTIKTFNTGSISGSIINNADATIETLNVTGNVANGITNNSNIGSLDLQENVTYDGSGSITNALDIAGSKTLNASTDGINILFNDDATGTINNAGIISGNLNNQKGSTIKTFNTGSISGSIANDATIETLNVDSNVGSIANYGEINTLTIQNGSNIANGITNDSNIAKLNVSSNVSYSGDNGNISQELVINQGNGQTTTFTIQGTNQTLTLGGTGNGGVKTITNDGTIIGNLINTLTTDWTFGVLQGNFTNNGNLTAFNTGSITGILTNTGIINTLNTSKVGGSIDNNGNLVNLIVDSNKTLTGNGSITNSLVVQNNSGNGFTLTIGNNGAGNLNFNATDGTIGNAGTINGNIINSGIITSFTNSGSFDGNLTNNKTIENLTTGAITGNITNAGSITTLIASGNVTNGITNKASSTITTLTINNGASLGSGITNEGNITTLINNQANTSITNSQNIGTLDINANTTYSGSGSISNALEVAQGDTLTIGSGSDTLNFHATNGTIKNEGTIKGTIDNKKGSSILVFDNSGSITGIINNGHIVEFTNNASGIIDNFVNNTTISFFENKGVIENFSGSGIIYGVLNSKEIAGNFENVATSLKNTGTITGNVQLIGNQQNCKDDICQDLTSDLINTGTIGDVANNTGGTIINQKDDVLNSISNGEENGVDSAIIVGNVENSGEIKDIINYNNGTIQGIINNKDADSIIGKIQNTGVMGGISNAGNITTINTGSITGSIANSGEITTLKVTGNVTNGITNDSNITNLTINQGVSLGNNGISNNAGNIANLTIDKGVNLGSGITNNAAIGNFTNNANITYGGSGSITGNFINAKDSTITLNNNNLILNGKDNTFNNDGTLKGTISNIGALASFTNTGSITGLESGNITGLLSNSNTGIIDNLVVDGNVSQMQNVGNIADAIIKSEITNGIINGDSNYKQATIGKLDIQASLGSNGLQNAGTITSLINNFSNTNLINAGNIGSLDIQKNLNYSGNGSITDSIDIASNTTLTTNGITLKANNGSVNNLGTLAGILTLEGSSNSITNSGSITTIINNAKNSILTNDSNIGSLEVNKNLNYSGSGSITNYAIIAENTTLNNSTALIFASNNQGLENKGIITGLLENKGNMQLLSNSGTTSQINGDITNSGLIANLANQGTISGDITNNTNSTITSFINSGTISGNLYNDGHIDTLTNTGTMGTIYNTSKETIVALDNDKGATIEAVNNTGNINIITNHGTINGQITSQNNSEIQEIFIGENGIVNAKGTLDSSNMQDTSNDAVSLDTINTTLIHNQGTIKGNVRVVGQGSVIGEINNQDTISGCILADGGKIGNINNTNGAIANCMSFSSGANVENITNEGTVSGTITNNSGSITINNGGSGSIGGITTSNGGTTNISNGKNGHIDLITNTGSNSNSNIIEWNVGNPDNPNSPIKVAGDNLGGINTGKIYLDNVQGGKIYDTGKIVTDENGNPSDSNGNLADQLNNGQGIFDSLDTISGIFDFIDEGDGKFSTGLDTKELSGKTLGASLIYSSRMRQIDTNNMLREINVKNFKTDFEILEQRERLKNQQALLENYKQQRESYLNGLTKDNKELKRVSSKESTSLSTYANNSNIKSDAIEVVDYYNKDTLASLDNLQATTKANQETYSNLDLLRELDDIFISHTGDKDNLYTFALPYTRYTSAQLDGGVGTLKSHASGILAGAQAKLPNERGILGIYFGYESSDKQVGQQRLDFDEKVYYGGLTYYNVFARKGVSEYYLSANTRIDKGDTDLYKTYRTGSTTINSQVDSYGYGADLKVGANYYNIYNNSVLSPEIGISYQGISTDSFRLRHLGGVSEHYYTQDVNFFDISASLRWQRAWNNVFKTMASLGAMYNVYNDAKGSGVIAGLKQSADINVEELYGTTQVGVSYALGENANIALNYSGIFANGVQSHAGYIRLGVWW